jgi:hypothetical protein
MPQDLAATTSTGDWVLIALVIAALCAIERAIRFYRDGGKMSPEELKERSERTRGVAVTIGKWLAILALVFLVARCGSSTDPFDPGSDHYRGQ